MRREVAVHVGNSSRNGCQKFFSILVGDDGLFGKSLGARPFFIIGQSFICESEDGKEPGESVFVVKELFPGIFAHIDAAHEAHGPIVAVGFSMFIFQKQWNEEILGAESFTDGVPVMDEQAKHEFCRVWSREDLVIFKSGIVAENLWQVFGRRNELGAAMKSGEETVEFFEVHGAIVGELVEEFAKGFELGVPVAIQAFGSFVVLVHRA